ncbi:hypothetical protein EV368DRAFT_39893 [Lentinula lateritia]|nr:hypothetical protein EV368DRAFT_39893 [Lentinula lateritia]
MSRRESRVSISARQNDALFEFENCMFSSKFISTQSDPRWHFAVKKKFLLANKHITKLNSTLSVRIEELNAQISTLYTENLRLRASEINLAAQLKREREKSRKIISETEAAALGLTKHLSFLRQAFCITEEASSSSSSPTPPRATQRPLPSADSPNSLLYPRLSRAPTIPLIYEDDEPSDPTEDEDEAKEKTPSPRRRIKVKRLSGSRLPLLSRVSSPPPITAPIDRSTISASNPTRRKPLRRQSGLLVRQGSPITGLHEAAEDDKLAAVLDEVEEEEVPVVKKERRKIVREKGKEKEKDHETSLRKKLRDEIGNEGKKFKLADVTNSPRSQPSQSVDAVELDVARTSNHRREFLSSSPPRSSSGSYFNSNKYLPIPQQSSSSPQIPATHDNQDLDSEFAQIGGRERRVRKSVNYAEPKLNTKMRKPDSEPGGSSLRKRKSASAVMSSHPECQPSRAQSGANPAQLILPASRPGSSADVASQPLASATSSTSIPSRRAKSRSYLYTAEDVPSPESDDADTEYNPLSGAARGGPSWVNTSERKKAGRRVSVEDDAARRHSLAV